MAHSKIEVYKPSHSGKLNLACLLTEGRQKVRNKQRLQCILLDGS